MQLHVPEELHVPKELHVQEGFLCPQETGSNGFGVGLLRQSLAIGVLAARSDPEASPRNVELLDVLAYLEQLTNAPGDGRLTT